MIGFGPSTIEIIKILVEISEKIAVKIRHYFQQNAIEKDKTEFYERTKKYYERIRKLYYKNEGSPERLAMDIAKDNLFSFIVGHEDTESICNALLYVDKISKRRKREREETNIKDATENLRKYRGYCIWTRSFITITIKGKIGNLRVCNAF